MQFHEVIRPTDPESIFADGGSIEAMLEAQKSGKVRFIGFTGHKSPDIHLHMLAWQRVTDFGSIRADATQRHGRTLRKFWEQGSARPYRARNRCSRHEANGQWLDFEEQYRSTGRVPSLCDESADQCVITGCDSLGVLDQAINAARTFRPMDEVEVASLLAITAPAAGEGKIEGYKTTNTFDGTIQNPDWLL